MNDEVMSLCIEKFDLTTLGSSNRGVKKYMFSVYMSDQLIKDPSSFQPRVVTRELQRAVNRYKVQKFDLLFFTIVHEGHWIDACANLLHKQWNVFDSLTAKGKQSVLKWQANNLITNFTTLAQECEEFNVNVASFDRVDLEDYPKQTNLCDCGFFGLLFVENFDGKIMKEFSKEDIPLFRKKVAYDLFNHPMNNAPKEEAFEEELAD